MGSFLSTDPKAEQLAAVGTACVIAVCGVVYLMRNRVMPLPPVVVPSQWKKVAEVSALYLYPVKSGRAREVDSAECTKMGLKHGAYRDRFFMLVSEEGELVSGRLYPAVVLLRLEIDGSQLTLRCTGQEDLTVNVDNYHERREATVHGTKFNARCMGMAVSDWLTSAFVPYEEDRRRRIFLVFHDQTSTQRLVETSKFQDLLRPTDGPFFADAVPYLLCSESSVADLQEKIRQNGAKFVDSEPEVQVLDFRPNIVVRQSADGPPLQPFDEDNWLWIRFGEGGPIFRKGGDCTRCKFTTVSHEHGVQRRSAEPLISMKKYRQFDDPEAKKWSKFKSRFGAYYAAEVEGSVSVGDSVYLGYSS
ncbi:unnamed protein product [Cyprideis torosa]|uniref:Uncharacterized protein n=1 Tax=Cyprideis torosa TaxID=163714 RepID=A0A7R8W2D6_9CRUS|nr:unnamed protein product [Cyprideis torosa]CAG0881857.1 unnamed protein product [Cyprideis torosa]